MNLERERRGRNEVIRRYCRMEAQKWDVMKSLWIDMNKIMMRRKIRSVRTNRWPVIWKKYQKHPWKKQQRGGWKIEEENRNEKGKNTTLHPQRPLITFCSRAATGSRVASLISQRSKACTILSCRNYSYDSCDSVCYCSQSIPPLDCHTRTVRRALHWRLCQRDQCLLKARRSRCRVTDLCRDLFG